MPLPPLAPPYKGGGSGDVHLRLKDWWAVPTLQERIDGWRMT